MLKKIIKRGGKTIEEFEAGKLNKWMMWSSEEVRSRVNWPSIVQKTVKDCDEIVDSQALNERLMRNLIRKKSWPYALMAGRIYNAILRKKMFDDKMPSVRKLQKKLTSMGLMEDMGYSDEEYIEIEGIVDHGKDMRMAQFQVKQIVNKYGISIRTKTRAENFETPQYVFIRMAMKLAQSETDGKRLKEVKAFYDEISNCIVNAPSPNYSNLGTGHNGLASCCLYTVDDNAKSLAIGDHIAYTMTYMSSGIGGYLNTRSLGDDVRGGAIEHQGKFYYYKAQTGAVKANTQGGRGGACTSYFTVFDPEVIKLVMLQNPLTPTDAQIRDIHFAVMWNKLFVKKLLQKKDYFTFNSYTAPDLHAALFSGDEDKFEELYNKYENDPTFVKNYLSARDVGIRIGQQRHETSTLYRANIAEINRHTPFKDPIHSANLCVAYNTPILTKEHGYVSIGDYADKEVHVWNGQKWSKVTIKKTGDNQKLLTVVTKYGSLLEATEYHKWYVQTQNFFGGLGKVVEKRTHELLPGDKLIKFDLSTVDHGTDTLPMAYENGFYTGDGTHLANKGIACIYLYNDKRYLFDHFDTSGSICHVYPVSKRISLNYKEETLLPKFTIPANNYTLSSRLNWLEGLFDSDGCITDNKGCKSIQLVSINFDFLTKLRLMLQELGINSSISKANVAGYRLMPDDNGGSAEYFCKDSWRILISNSELVKLKDLGLQTKRLDLSEVRQGNRDAKQFDSIVTVLDNGINSDTYCFTEPERNMGMFMGVLAGNCVETVLPTGAYHCMTDLYKNEDVSKITLKSKINGAIQVFKGEDILIDGKLSRRAWEIGHYKDSTVFDVVSTYNPETAICSLAGIVITNVPEGDDEAYERAAYYSLKMADKCIDLSHYELPHVGYTTKRRRSIGVGMLGVALHMARKGLKYDTLEGRNELHRIAERHMYFLIKASLKLGKELGNAEWMYKTKWPEGWLPIDTYKKNVDELVTVGLQYDWETLRAEIIANGGIRHSVLAAHMPTESSSKASGAPNGIYPIRDLNLLKTDANNALDWVAVDNDILGDKYQLAWEVNPIGMIQAYAVIQKFTDQAISADEYADRVRKPVIDSDELIEVWRAAAKYGEKSAYYQNSFTLETTKLDDIPAAEAVAEVKQISALDAVAATSKKSFEEMLDAAASDTIEVSDVGCAGGVCTL